MNEVQSKATQAQKVLRHMEEFGGITPLQAMQQLGVMRLASRIHDLRRAGHNIKDEMITVPTRDKGTARVCLYSIAKSSVPVVEVQHA